MKERTILDADTHRLDLSLSEWVMDVRCCLQLPCKVRILYVGRPFRAVSALTNVGASLFRQPRINDFL
jgi:hypothetical protein